MAVIGGFRCDMSITRKIDGNFGNVSASVLFSKVENGGNVVHVMYQIREMMFGHFSKHGLKEN